LPSNAARPETDDDARHCPHLRFIARMVAIALLI
jgi:hypothetical protein